MGTALVWFGCGWSLRRALLVDLAAPGAGLAAARLDELLEPLEVALRAVLRDAERVADALDEPLGLVLHLHHHAGRVVRDPVERHDAGVRRAGRALPRDALVRALLGDDRVPLLLLAADLGDPVQARVVELVDALDALHEPRELLELRPLVVRRVQRHLDLDALFDRAHDSSSSSGSCLGVPTSPRTIRDRVTRIASVRVAATAAYVASAQRVRRGATTRYALEAIR